jgi:hypothetical protein
MTVCADLTSVCISHVIKKLYFFYNCDMYHLICDDFMYWSIFWWVNVKGALKMFSLPYYLVTFLFIALTFCVHVSRSVNWLPLYANCYHIIHIVTVSLPLWTCHVNLFLFSSHSVKKREMHPLHGSLLCLKVSTTRFCPEPYESSHYLCTLFVMIYPCIFMPLQVGMNLIEFCCSLSN